MSFNVKPKSFSQELVGNIPYLRSGIVNIETVIGSSFVGNIKTFEANTAVSVGDPVFLRGDGKIERLPYITPQTKPNLKTFFHHDNINSSSSMAYNSKDDLILYIYAPFIFAGTDSRIRLIAMKVNDNNKITFGPEIELDPAIWIKHTSVDTCYMSMYNNFVIAGRGVCSTVSVDPITLEFTLGTPLSYTPPAVVTHVTYITPISSNQFALHFTGKIFIGNVLETTIDFIVDANTDNSSHLRNIQIYDPTSNRLVFVANDNSFRVGTITNTVTYGQATPFPISVYQSYVVNLQVVITDRIFIVGISGGSHYRLFATTATIDTITNTITINPVTYFEDISQGQGRYSSIFNVIKCGDKLIAIQAFETGFIRFITFTQSGNTISLEGIGVLSNVENIYGSTSIWDGRRIFSVYQEVEGMAIEMLVTPVNSTPFVPYRFLGIVQRGLAAGESGEVLIFGRDRNQQGLIPGEYYYYDGVGLTTSKTAIPVGIAIRSDQLLLAETI